MDTITATYSSATGTAAVTWTASSCDSGAWPAQVTGVPTVKANMPRGFYIGVNANGDFALKVTHVLHHPLNFVHFTGTITTDGSLSNVEAIMLEKADMYTVSTDKHTLKFDFRNVGFIDGISFVPMCGSTITFNLSIDGVAAPTSTINLGVPSTNPSTNPFTFTRSS